MDILILGSIIAIMLIKRLDILAPLSVLLIGYLLLKALRRVTKINENVTRFIMPTLGILFTTFLFAFMSVTHTLPLFKPMLIVLLVILFSIGRKEKVSKDILVFISITYLLTLIITPLDRINWEDSYGYLERASNTLEYRFDTSRRVFFEIALATNMALTNRSIESAQRLMVFFWASLPILTYYLSKKITGNKARFAALMILLNPLLFWYRNSILPDITATVLVVTALLLLLYKENMDKRVQYLLIGIFSVVSILTKDLSIIPLSLFLCATILFEKEKRKQKMLILTLLFSLQTGIYLLSERYRLYLNSILNLIFNVQNMSASIIPSLQGLFLGYSTFPMPVLIFILSGLLVALLKKDARILAFTALSTAAFILLPGLDSERHAFILYPLLYAFLPLAFKKNRNTGAILVLSTVLVSLFVNQNSKYIMLSNELLSVLNITIGFVFVLSILGIFLKQKIPLIMLRAVLIFIIVSTSIMVAYSIKDVRHVPDTEIRSVANFVIESIPPTMGIVTNTPHALSTYIHSSHNLTKPPYDYNEFYEYAKHSQAYLLLYDVWPFGEWENYPYLEKWMFTNTKLPVYLELIYEEKTTNKTLFKLYRIKPEKIQEYEKNITNEEITRLNNTQLNQNKRTDTPLNNKNIKTICLEINYQEPGNVIILRNNEGDYFDLRFSTGKPYTAIYQNQKFTSIGGTKINQTINKNEWNLLCATHDEFNNELRLYINNELADKTPIEKELATFNNAILGDYQEAAIAQIKNITLITRPINQEQIQQIMNNIPQG